VNITDSARRMLKFLRESRGYSQQEVSDRLQKKVSPSTIDNWERGLARLTFENAEMLLRAMEITPAHYFKLIEAHQEAIGASPAYPLPEQARLPLIDIYDQSGRREPTPSTYAVFARIEAAAHTITEGLRELMHGVYLVEFERLRERAGSRQAPTPAPPSRKRGARKTPAAG
jgi:transcriptional regulator with XRE-family HTH domain